MHITGLIFKREFWSYFSTPLASVFLIIFLVLTGVLTFFLGGFFGHGQADLQSFFFFHPWMYLFFIPAMTMRLWAEERKSGTIEHFLTLPITMTQAVLGKFLAAWMFVGLALVLTFPIWLTVNYLGNPDNGIILAGYIGSFLMAGAYIAIGACCSSFTKNQVIAFIVSAAIAFMFTATGASVFLNFFSGWAPDWLVSSVSNLSFITHFNSISRGVLDVSDLIFFISIITGFLFINTLVVDLKKAE